MQSKSRISKKNQIYTVNSSCWTPSRIIFCTIYVTLFLVSGAYTASFLKSLISKPTEVFPTSLPWINSESECNHTNRVWLDGKCWDYEQGKDF